MAGERRAFLTSHKATDVSQHFTDPCAVLSTLATSVKIIAPKSLTNRLFVQQIVDGIIDEVMRPAHFKSLLGKTPITNGFPSQRACNAESISLWCYHTYRHRCSCLSVPLSSPTLYAEGRPSRRESHLPGYGMQWLCHPQQHESYRHYRRWMWSIAAWVSPERS